MVDKPHIRVVAARIERDGCFLITQRRPEAQLPLLWEFPGGRVGAGESDAAALERTLRDRMGVGIQVGDLALHVKHAYERYTLDLLVYHVFLRDETPRPLKVNDIRWVPPEQFGAYRFPGADQQTVDALLSEPEPAPSRSPLARDDR